MSVNRPSRGPALGMPTTRPCTQQALALPVQLGSAHGPAALMVPFSSIIASDDHIFRRSLRHIAAPFFTQPESVLLSAPPFPHLIFVSFPVSMGSCMVLFDSGETNTKRKDPSPVQTPPNRPSQVLRHFHHRLS